MKALLQKQQTWGRSKHVQRDERFLSLAQVDKLYHELTSEICLKRVRIGLLLAEIRMHKACWCLDLLISCCKHNILYLKSPININQYRLTPTWTQRLTSTIH